MSHPNKPTPTNDEPALPALPPTLSSLPESSSATKAPEAEAAEEDLSFLAPPQADGERGRLGGYRVLRVLGQGGMGMVLEAEDVRLKRRIAIKVMKPEMAAKSVHRQRFLREAQAAAAVEHDHIVPILQVGEENGIPFIAMPFLKGEALDVRMKRGRLDVPEILTIGRQVAEGLAVAHEQGLVHRDIKPANIWLEELHGAANAFRVRILDFGLARVSQEEVKLTQSGAIMGTPAYMAPEQARGKDVDHRADLFSLGAVLYEIATGKRPFTGNDAMAIITSLALDTPVPPQQLNPELPPALAQLIMRLLEKQPSRRPQSAREAADALNQLQPKNVVVVVAKRKSATEISPWAGIDDPAPPPATTRKSASATQAAAAKPTSAAQLKPRKATPKQARFARRIWALPAASAVILGVGLLGYQLLSRGGKSAPTGPEGRREAPNKAAIVPGIAPSRQPVVKGDQMTFDLGKGAKLEVMKINAKGRTFLMGSPPDEPERSADEEQHAVTFNCNWYIGKHEVTQEQYQAIMNDNPAQYKDPKKPVEMVSSSDAKSFCAKLTERFKDQKVTFRLPSEAEWEFSCRAGATSAYSFGKSLAQQQAQFSASGGAKPVGSYEANALGLFDMHGNVYEWCEDYYGPYDKAPADGTAQLIKQTTDFCVLRGGNWSSGARSCRSAFRYYYIPGNRSNNVGFRVVVSSPDDDAGLDSQK